jgi:coenzyme F420 hydrogenase subunit beta
MTASLPPVLERVLRGQACAGCGLCAGIDPAIAMVRDPKGWMRPDAIGTPRPEINAILEQACPGARIAPWEDGTARTIDPIWGPHLRILTGHSTDQTVRHAASSGGALSALALYLLETGAVDRVLHVGMDPAEPLRTRAVRSNSREAVIGASGSRYAPVSPLAGLMAELQTPGQLLFIGKPCDVGALRQLMAVDPAVAARFPYLLSFFCAGTPSQDGTNRLVRKLGAEPDDVTHFRYRGDGWPGFATATTRDGRALKMGYAASWGDILSKEVQFRCKICADGVGGAADVAAADAWYGGDSGYPDFDEADGRSLIITRTAKGDALVRAAEATGMLATEPLAIGEIVKMQPAQARRKRELAARLAALALSFNPRPDVRGLKVADAARTAGIKANLKSMAGTLRRIVAGKR